LLRPDNPVKDSVKKISPLAKYAAQYWVTHAKFGNVAPCLRNAMEVLFDLDKPFFTAWLKLHDIDVYPAGPMAFRLFCPFKKSKAEPLYYAALCGFHDLTEHLIAKHPQQVTARGGYCVIPLVAALAREYFGIARLLLRGGAGATVNIQVKEDRTPLHAAVYFGYVEIVRFLLENNADVNSRGRMGETPLHYPSERANHSKDPNTLRMLVEVIRLLLQYGADINAQENRGWTPLHVAVNFGIAEVARVLLEHGAKVDVKDKQGRTAFDLALERNRDGIMKLLLEYGAKSSS